MIRKILERLRAEKKEALNAAYAVGIMVAIDIVKDVAKEYGADIKAPDRCHACENYSPPGRISNDCYVCGKGDADNYQPKGEREWTENFARCAENLSR